MRTYDRGDARRLVTALGIVALILSACTVGASPAASPSRTGPATPTPTVTPDPSPSPDVAGLFIARVRAMTEVSMLISGDLRMSGQVVTVTGRGDISGADQAMTITMTLGDIEETVEQVVIADHRYTRTGAGAWYESTAASEGSLGGAVTVSGAIDRGLEVKDGQRLHRLESDGAALGPSAIGFDGTGTVDLTFFARDDGTPVIMEFTVDLTQGSGASAQRLTGTLDFTFVEGAKLTITAPEPVFTTYRSEQGYALGYPVGWDRESSEGWEVFWGPNLEDVAVWVDTTGEDTLTSFSASDVYYLKTELKARIDSNTASTLGGEPARRIEYRTTSDDGLEYSCVWIDAIHGSKAVTLEWGAPVGNEAADTATFEYVIDSFEFTD